MEKTLQPIVGIIMGSDSDLKIMEAAAEILKTFDVPYELTIVSAHRTPLRMTEYAASAIDGQEPRMVGGIHHPDERWRISYAGGVQQALLRRNADRVHRERLGRSLPLARYGSGHGRSYP